MARRVGVSGPVLVFGHGAGAGHTHPWMIRVADGLADRGVRVVTFDFPYIEAGRRVPAHDLVAQRPVVLAGSLLHNLPRHDETRPDRRALRGVRHGRGVGLRPGMGRRQVAQIQLVSHRIERLGRLGEALAILRMRGRGAAHAEGGKQHGEEPSRHAGVGFENAGGGDGVQHVANLAERSRACPVDSAGGLVHDDARRRAPLHTMVMMTTLMAHDSTDRSGTTRGSVGPDGSAPM